ncbi:MAG: BamA/TamA family outer membrane protein [Vibrio gallaecicus]
MGVKTCTPIAMFLTVLYGSSVVAKEVNSAIPPFSLEVEKSKIQFESDVYLAEQHLEAYENAIQELEESDDADDAITDLEYGKKYYQEINGLPMFSLLGGPAYTPEQGVLAAIGGLYSFKTDRNQQDLQRSSVSAFIISNYVDSEVGYGLRAKHNLFWDNNDIQFKGEWNAGLQSKHYWGVGYDAAETVSQGDDTRYTAVSNNYKGDLSMRLHDEWFLGALLKLNYFNVTDEPLSGLGDENYALYSDTTFTWGLGARLKYDSRDVAVNAWSGSLFSTELLAYETALGSQLTYQKLDVDYRTYHSVDEGKVIALLANYKQAFGDVPYFDMPELGGATSMRGLYQGQYRDKTTAELTVEYRHTFSRNSGTLSAHGVTLWGGLGAIGSDISDLQGHSVTSYGVGYRYELQPRMNIRLDLGMSKHGAAFYFNFTEAF